jgi:hypothetical protein
MKLSYSHTRLPIDVLPFTFMHNYDTLIQVDIITLIFLIIEKINIQSSELNMRRERKRKENFLLLICSGLRVLLTCCILFMYLFLTDDVV